MEEAEGQKIYSERHKFFTIFLCLSLDIKGANGETSASFDIDMIIEKIPKERFAEMHEALVKEGFECMQSESGEKVYNEYLKNGDSVRYTRVGEFVPEMEIKFAKDSLDKYQLKNRKKLPFTGIDVYFSSIETNIAFKEEYLKSKKDLEDAKHLRIIYKGQIDEEEIKRIKKEILRLKMKK